MKKILMMVVAVVFTFLSFGLVTANGLTAKANYCDDADEYFLQYVSSNFTQQGQIDYARTPLYNAELEQNGRQYVFTIGNVNGYALMIEYQGEDTVFYEIEECVLNSVSPFAQCTGLPVYLTHNVYLEYKNQEFYDLATNTVVDSDTINEYTYKGFNYFGGTTASYTHSTVTVNYARKTTTEYSIQYDLPNILGSVPGGSCAHTAGTIILTYYDRFCINIMPNFDPYFNFSGTFIYRPNATEVYNMNLELVDMMLIGEPHAGTTFTEFQYGMQTFVQRQGYTYTSTNLIVNGVFNFNLYKNSVENNKPCAIFLTNFAMLDWIEEVDGQDTISSGYCPVSHVEAACGYRIDTYYDANDNVIDTRYYLKVASALISYNIGYLNINGVSTISKAISIYIS